MDETLENYVKLRKIITRQLYVMQNRKHPISTESNNSFIKKFSKIPWNAH